MKPREIYEVVYKTVTKEAGKAECAAAEGHKRFAKNLPDPNTISEEDAAILSAMVYFTPGDDWGLDSFFKIPLESGEMLGHFVRRNLPDFVQYLLKMEEVAKKYMK